MAISKTELITKNLKKTLSNVDTVEVISRSGRQPKKKVCYIKLGDEVIREKHYVHNRSHRPGDCRTQTDDVKTYICTECNKPEWTVTTPWRNYHQWTGEYVAATLGNDGWQKYTCRYCNTTDNKTFEGGFTINIQNTSSYYSNTSTKFYLETTDTSMSGYIYPPLEFRILTGPHNLSNVMNYTATITDYPSGCTCSISDQYIFYEYDSLGNKIPQAIGFILTVSYLSVEAGDKLTIRVNIS